MKNRVLICIGTKKGLFVAESSKSRGKFALRGPFGPGVAVYSALIDPRGTPKVYGSSCNPFFGMKVLRSTDLGKTFKETKSAPAFPKDDGRALANIWSFAASDDRKELWCGVEPASLFHSGDGGLCLHTIIRDGNRMHLGISTGGHYLSEDKSTSFTAANKGIGAGFSPD